MIANLLLVASALASFASAQTNATVTINPGSVDLSTRNSWCLAERNTCTSVCGGAGSTSANSCDPNLLTFTCTCTNGTSPDVSIYQQSLPAHICEEYVSQCVAAHPNDLEGITDCRATVCGNTTISADSSATTTAGSASTSGSASATGSSGSSQTAAAASSSSSSAFGMPTAMALAKNYGTGVLAVGMAAAFGMAL